MQPIFLVETTPRRYVGDDAIVAEDLTDRLDRHSARPIVRTCGSAAKAIWGGQSVGDRRRADAIDPSAMKAGHPLRRDKNQQADKAANHGPVDPDVLQILTHL